MAQDNFNVMDLLEDDAWFQEAARLEDEVDCDALAGFSWGSHLGVMVASSEGYSHYTLVRSMVLQAWQALVTEWDLGISSDSAVAKGQELIMARLQHPTPEVQETLLALLEAKLSKPQGAWEMSEEVHTTIRLVLSQVLTREDWEAIAVSVSQQVYAQVRKQELAMVDN